MYKKIENGHRILSVYLTLGYPSLEKTVAIINDIADLGVDIVEIGIPFSDPMADGPTIQKTSQHALDNGTKPDMAFQVIKDVQSNHPDLDMVIMTYGNIPYNYGYKKFVAKARSVDVSGIILPDIPPEHFPEELTTLDPIFLVPPNIEIQRAKYLASESRGFLYIMSKLGITGSKYNVDNRLKTIYNELSSYRPDLPLLQGFGIDGKKSVRKAINAGADGVIVGSELLRRIGKNYDYMKTFSFIKQLRKALDH